MRNTKQINFVLPKEVVDKMNKIARERSLKEDKDISLADLIREFVYKSIDEISTIKPMPQISQISQVPNLPRENKSTKSDMNIF